MFLILLSIACWNKVGYNIHNCRSLDIVYS